MTAANQSAEVPMTRVGARESINAEEAPRRPMSMIALASEHAEEVSDLTWDAEQPPPVYATTTLDALLEVADDCPLAEALRRVTAALVRGHDAAGAVACFESALPGSERVVAVVDASGSLDRDATAALAIVTSRDLDEAAGKRFGGATVVVCDPPVGAHATCRVWLAAHDGFDAMAGETLRVAGLVLRAAFSQEVMSGSAAHASVDVARRDRRDVVLGRLTRAATPALIAAHASLASVQASLAAELAEMRVAAPRHPAPRASAALLQEASSLTHHAWRVLSGVACLGDDASGACEPGQVVQSVVALLGPYLASRAVLEAAPAELPEVVVSPALLSEALVVFVSRVAHRFVDRIDVSQVGRVAVNVVTSARGVEIEVRAGVPAELGGVREHDDVVAEVFNRALRERGAGVVELLRDGVGAPRFRLMLHRR